MKVILLQNVRGLGRTGDVKEVAEGYARNFLLGKGLAKLATGSSIKQVEIAKKKQAEQEKIDLENARELARRLDDIAVVLKMKNKNGKLFGAVHQKDITEELKNQGFDIDQKCLKLGEAIKEIGNYEVKAELGHGIEARLSIVIESSS